MASSAKEHAKKTERELQAVKLRCEELEGEAESWRTKFDSARQAQGGADRRLQEAEAQARNQEARHEAQVQDLTARHRAEIEELQHQLRPQQTIQEVVAQIRAAAARLDP
ncbi:hypothetical protein A4X09_0g570 [Tilletia walkeri]|uniref:Uncharacterized protein n=1 Tax=Tilletia walkeri TaxID=117179 RepID=A0A8X7T8X6_9BASI|nr:hypothetical protein A4X09_0g570 [Tilletia walkeri]